MDRGIFLTIRDLQKLLGCESYRTANVEHMAIRDVLKKNRISIQEYCKYEGLDFEYIWNFLRGKKNNPGL